MISRRVSRLTLNGMFLITMAVGIISSSGLTLLAVLMLGWAEAKGVVFALRWLIGGEPPEDEKSELLLGDNDRLSPEESSHCYQRKDGEKKGEKKGRESTEGRAAREGFLIGDWPTTERGLYWDGAEMGGEVEK
jgi:hypothetical protein